MDDDDDDRRSRAILIVTAVFLALSAVSVLLRCFVRSRIVRAFGRDDILMVLAMVLNLAFAICGILGARYGIGRKLVHFEFYPQNLPKALLCWWLGQMFYVMTCVVGKISIIITLLRITVRRAHAWVLYGVTCLATSVGLVFLFFTIFECHPISYFWERLSTTEHGRCVSKQVLIDIAYLYSVGAAVTDLTIGLFPVVLIWNLRMNRRTKVAIVGILGIGCIASAAVVIRIPFVHHYGDTEFLCMDLDLTLTPRRLDGTLTGGTDDSYQISIWSNVEAGLGITAGCLTTLRPLIRFLRDGSASRSRNINRGSFHLFSNVAQGVHRLSRSKQEDREDAHQLWTGSKQDHYHGVTTTIMGSQWLHPASGSEDDLSPISHNNHHHHRWKADRSVRVTVRGA
ncbi:uncharacterized protein N7459_002408 [Penicillium hispanicum]|uniref:uncharacterized protein n=1 Tax=Penicillium hispanicum TaxID=1080232 RepID=UPI00254093EE|nr:uncharacterized protein N7459_002408 [Penicillium hispanicum]KAJ5592039.1 hypothetical protein N7459_002408 [Penicillium hispanicum]